MLTRLKLIEFVPEAQVHPSSRGSRRDRGGGRGGGGGRRGDEGFGWYVSAFVGSKCTYWFHYYHYAYYDHFEDRCALRVIRLFLICNSLTRFSHFYLFPHALSLSPPLDLCTSQIPALLALFDRKGKGFIDFTDFVAFCESKLTGSGNDDGDEINSDDEVNSIYTSLSFLPPHSFLSCLSSFCIILDR